MCEAFVAWKQTIPKIVNVLQDTIQILVHRYIFDIQREMEVGAGL